MTNGNNTNIPFSVGRLETVETISMNEKLIEQKVREYLERGTSASCDKSHWELHSLWHEFGRAEVEEEIKRQIGV